MEMSILKGVTGAGARINNFISAVSKQNKTEFVNSGIIDNGLVANGSAEAIAIPENATNDSDRFDKLAIAIENMLLSKKGAENTINACLSQAESLGFRKPIVGLLVRKITLDLTKGKSKDVIKEDCANFLKF